MFRLSYYLTQLLLIRPFEDDKGALSGAIHSAIMDNTLPRLKLLIEVEIIKYVQY